MYAFHQLDTIAKKLESTKAGGLAKTAKQAESEVPDWFHVLARCFQLQDAIDMIELDRVLAEPPEELVAYQRGLKRPGRTGGSSSQVIPRICWTLTVRGVPDVAFRRALGGEVHTDVDDRPRSVGWRVRRASNKWIPYIVVVGVDETATRLRVQIRDGSVMTTNLAELADLITSRFAGYPRTSLGL